MLTHAPQLLHTHGRRHRRVIFIYSGHGRMPKMRSPSIACGQQLWEECQIAEAIRFELASGAQHS